MIKKHRAALLVADTTSLAAPLRRTFWTKAFEGLKAIDEGDAGKEYLTNLYNEFSPSKPESPSSEEEEDDDDDYAETESQDSSPIEIKQIDLTAERPIDEQPFSLQEATKLCQIEPVNVDNNNIAIISY